MSALNNRPYAKMSSFRWVICSLLFFATTVNYMDRQVLSLTWKEFIAPEFHWTDTDYGVITSIFSIIYAVANLFAGRFIDWMGSKKGYLWTIFIWSAGACLHALCGWATDHTLGLHDAAELVGATGALASTVAITSVYYFIAARVILGIGEAGNFPAAIKVTAEYFPKKDRAFATSIFNAGATVGALLAPVSIPALASYFQKAGVGNGWEMAFLIIGGLGFIWMGFWMWLYRRPESNPFVNKAELEYIEQDNVTKNETPAEKVAVEDDRKNEIPFLKCFKYRQTWAIFFGRFLTDGVWWFFLFGTAGIYFRYPELADYFRHSTDAYRGALSAYPAFDLWRQTSYNNHGKDRSQPLCRANEGDVHIRLIPSAYNCRAAPRQCLGLVAGDSYRYSGSRTPVMVCQYIFGCRRHVPQKHNRHDCRDRRSRQWSRLFPRQPVRRHVVRLCRCHRHELHWIHRKACRIFYSLLLLRNSLYRRMVCDEIARAPI